MSRLKLIAFYICLRILTVTAASSEGNFEDADLANEFITMSFSSSQPYDLRHTIPGEPDIDYPIYSAIPKTSFDCGGRHEGYYADVETRCQVFRICTNTDIVGRGFAFLCPNGTLFSQRDFVCDWYRNVDCNESEQYYSKNDGNRIGTRSEIMETVRQMMEHPMKTISIALNRAKTVPNQPATLHNFQTTGSLRDSTAFRTTPKPVRNFPTHQIMSRRPPITVQEIENAAGHPSTIEEGHGNDGTDIDDSSSLIEGVKSTHTSQFPLKTRFGTASQTSSLPSHDGHSSSQSSVVGTRPTSTRINSKGGKGTSTSEEEVYVSNLGELSTDPEANFDHQTARIIAEPTSSSIHVKITSESGAFTSKPLNFAAKVNAGLNGEQVVNNNEIIAPEYVRNIVNKNISPPQTEIQPPPFSFASNVNSLLDEVGAELEAQTTTQVQLQTPSDSILEPTKKPFRFLSRGFSYSSTTGIGPYKYGPATASRSSFPRVQPINAIPSPNSIFETIPLSTTPATVESTKAVHISIPESPSETTTTFKSNVAANSFGRTTNELIENDDQVKSKSKVGSPSAAPESGSVDLRFGDTAKLNHASESPTTEKQSDGDKHEIVDNPDSDSENVGEETNAGKRAQKLLIAGVKQTILNDISDKDGGDDFEELAPIVPLYIRVPDQHNSIESTASISYSTVTSTTASPSTSTAPLTTTTPALITTPTQETSLSSTTASSSTATSLPETTESSVEVTQSNRKYTVSSIRRRQSTRPFAYSRRQNVVRSIVRSTSSTSTTSTTASPRSRSRSGSIRFTTTSPTSTTSTTRPTISSRRRGAISRFSFGSSRRNDTSSTVTSTTTSSPDKVLAVRSSDKDLSDLTAVASTYSIGTKRDYNSIQQNSPKSTQTQRRRPNHRNRTSTTTTTTSTTTTTTETPLPSPSLPTPTLAPFTHEALSPISTTSTTPDPMPASYLSFNDLTKAIIDDSVLQTFRKNQDHSGSTLRPPTAKSQPQAPVRQQARVSAPRSSQKNTFQSTGKSPYVPLKQFIVTKFGANNIPTPSVPPKPTLPTLAPRNELLAQMQKKPAYAAQYSTQQHTVRHDYAPRTVVQQQVAQQPRTQYSAQRQPHVQQQRQYNQIRQQSAQRQLRPVQSMQFQPIPSISYTLPTQQQTIQGTQHIQRPTIQQGQQILQGMIPAQPQQQNFQRTQHQRPLSPPPLPFLPTQQVQPQVQHQQRALAPPALPFLPTQQTQPQVQLPVFPPIQQSTYTQQNPSAQIQIFPSQIAATQSIPGEDPSSPSSIPEYASVNIRLPTNLSGLIPNTNLYEPRLNTADSFGRAQKRYDNFEDESNSRREPKSAYSGVSSYDVPLSSVGRLANDITNLLRRVRRL